jgi:glycosyltransferase involved in cell wall biosynthesis
MRILFVCGYFPFTDSDDPIIPAYNELASALVKLGHTVAVITFSNFADKFAGEGHYVVNGFDVYQIQANLRQGSAWSSGLELPHFARISVEAHQLHQRLNQIVQSFNPDVIDCQEFNGLSFFFAREHKYPLLLHCYGALAHVMRNGERHPVTRLDSDCVEIFELACIAECDYLIASSEDVARKRSNKSGRPLCDFEIIKVPLSPPHKLAKPVKSNNKIFPRLFFFGENNLLKGAVLLIESLPTIAQDFPNFELMIGGTEPEMQNILKSYSVELKERLDDLSLRGRVKFLGKMTREQITQNVVDADVCVFPSIDEAAGYSCLEALSYGGAVIASAVDGLHEYHESDKSTVLVTPNSAYDLALGIVRLAIDNQLRDRLKIDGAKHILAACNPEKIGCQTIRAYEQAILNFDNRTNASYSFKVMSKLISVLLEQTIPTASTGTFLAPGLERENVKQSVKSEGVVTAVSIVQNLGDMVSGHLSRVWKEGYEAGFEEATKGIKKQ